jgi:hypothetical protein
LKDKGVAALPSHGHRRGLQRRFELSV